MLCVRGEIALLVSSSGKYLVCFILSKTGGVEAVSARTKADGHGHYYYKKFPSLEPVKQSEPGFWFRLINLRVAYLQMVYCSHLLSPASSNSLLVF
jgi:hypothetical protein